MCVNRQRGWRKRNWEHICVCERLCGRRETASERERESERGRENQQWRGCSLGMCGRPKSREWDQQVHGWRQAASELADTRECERRGADYREQREGEESKTLAGGGGSDSPIPPLPITAWTPDAARVSFAIVLHAGHQFTRVTRRAFPARLICVAPRYPAGWVM